MSKKRISKTMEWLLKHYMPFFKKFGTDQEAIVDYYERWKQNRVDRIEDYLWHIFNLLLLENAKQSLAEGVEDIDGYYKRNADIYLEMLYYRRKVEGKPANELQKELVINKLLSQIESSPYEMEVVISTVQDCDICQHLNNKIISVKEALMNKIIPYDACERVQGCVCSYCTKAKKGKDGRLIRKRS